MSRAVLLIDDDRLQFRLTQQFFEAFPGKPYALAWAATYDDGLTQLLSGRFAVCLLDYQLGDRDGLQLIQEAQARGNRTPIVFLTAESASQVDVAAMNAGALDYLVKGEMTPRLLERSLRYALKLGETLDALRELATHDPLTGLLNRREFDRILAEEQERALRFGDALALVMVDLDHFKAINDAHGHPVGDAVLRETARRLLAQVRTVDRVVRLGGEEFSLVLVGAQKESALEVARRVCAAFRSELVRVNDTLALSVTVSAGVAALPQDARTSVELVAVADRALYAAKSAGRDRAVAAPG